MRNIKPTELLPKKYSIESGNIVENENGDYFSKQSAEHYLKNKDTYSDNDIKKLKKFDENQLVKAAIKYCRSKYNEILSQNSSIVNFLNMPSKEFEIINLDIYGGKTFLLRTYDLPSGENRELYYKFDIANKIYENLIDIKDSTLNEFEETQDFFLQDIMSIQHNIDSLKNEDEKAFNEDMQTYNIIARTPIYTEYRALYRDRENLLQKNNELKSNLDDYNHKIKELSQKLKISLDKIEVLQAPKTFFEKLKDLFKNDNKRLLLPEKK